MLFGAGGRGRCLPDNPNALDSGAALVVNYGNLTAGPHLLGLEIEAANGAMLAFTRAITVLKIGGFDFLDQFDLSQAAVRLEGEEIVLTDVRVREQTSGREQVLTLRFRWDTATQGFVLAANDPPVASDQRVETERDHAVAITLWAQDADGDPLRFEVVDEPVHGRLTGEPPQVRYTPDTGFLGEDRFTFLAQDFASASNVATVAIAVTSAPPPNDPPQVDLDPTNLSGQRPNFATTFTEDSALHPIVSPLMTVIDPDSATLASASATLTNVLDTGQEVLAVDPATVAPNTPIIAMYNTASGLLSLTGAAPLSQYQAALRTLTYTNASQNPDPIARRIRVIAHDGAATSPPVTSTVSIQAVNDQPTFTASDPPPVKPNAGPQTLLGWATFDPGAPEETGQTVRAYTVSAVSNPGLFVAPPAVATNGTLTYTPAANTSGTSTFTVTVQDDGGTANGGVDTSAPQTFTITVTSGNNPPINTVPGVQTVNEDATLVLSVANGNAFSTSDADAGGATVQFMLSVTNGTLTLSSLVGLSGTGNGTASLTYQGTITAINTALGSGVTYAPTADFAGDDTLTFTVNDLGNTGGPPQSDTDTVTVTVAPVNDAPVLMAGATLAYTEDDPATALDATITVADVDDANLELAIVQLTTNYQNGQDVLGFTDTPNITGNFTAATGTLTLTGTDTLANYQAALRSVTYRNTSNTPITTDRTVTWSGNDGAATSTPVTSTVTVAATNDAPVLTAGATLAYTEGDTATVIDATITVPMPTRRL